jgi:hypothetical protein
VCISLLERTVFDTAEFCDRIPKIFCFAVHYGTVIFFMGGRGYGIAISPDTHRRAQCILHISSELSLYKVQVA